MRAIGRSFVPLVLLSLALPALAGYLVERHPRRAPRPGCSGAGWCASSSSTM